MLIWIWTRNDETGLLDDEFKDGDPLKTEPDSFELSIGSQEKKSWLIIKVPDPPNLEKVREDLDKSEYRSGSTPDAPHPIRRKRLYTLDWRSKFTSDEITIVEDAAQMLPDGDLASGGSVAAGVVSGKFTMADLSRK